MDDSDQDFVDLCSNFKLLKRVRRKPNNDTTAAPRNTHLQPSTSTRNTQLQPSTSTQSRDTNRRKRTKRDVESSTGSAAASSKPLSNEECEAKKQPDVNGSIGHVSGDMGAPYPQKHDHSPEPAETGGSIMGPPVPAGSGESKASNIITEKGAAAGAKEKVLFRMQQFKRVSPQKMMHSEKNPSRGTEHEITPQSVQKDSPGPSSCGLQDSDEALALRLQQELDREAADAQAVDLEDRGLFFCQLCNRDLSHMTAEGRTQHINRCLDESEDSAPAPPPPPSVPNCPICGKRFKSQKSRSVHLKRCSSDMGVAPAVLLQVLQRQATEAHSDSSVANQAGQTGSSKRKGPTDPDLPARKRRKPKKKAQPLDEDTMVALALSSSLMERMKEEQSQREMEREIQRQTAAPHTSVPPLLRWKPDAGKGRGKRKKDGVPRPPPLLLVQDAETALRRLQERVAVLLLCGPASSPPTPTRCPSSLAAQSSAAPLWHKSQLRDGGPSCPSEFYTPELGEFIVAWKSAETEMFSNKVDPETFLCPPAREGTPLTMAESSTLPSLSQTVSTPAPSTPGTGHLPVGSQVLRDLIDLADEGMTLSQWGYAPTRPAKVPDLQVSGFVPEEPAEQDDLHLSGFLPEKTPTHCQAPRSASQPGVPTAKCTHKSEPLSRLASDLNCMVNNPQLSDVQIQVDTGEVYFAHSFMLYARCPLLVQMVHDSGFGVQEEDMPAAQRVLLGDVPGQAVYFLLQYLYTAHCPVTASLLPHVLELASRFDLEDLRQLCELYARQTENEGEGAGEDGPGQEHQSGVEEAFRELLRSMWTEEDEDDDGRGGNEERDGDTEMDEGTRAGGVTSGDGEMPDEHVNEEEIEEIYEFAATQRKREEERREGDLDSETERDDEIMRPVIAEPQRGSLSSEEKSPHGSPQCDLNASLDRSYNRLFSESWGAYEEDSSSRQPEKQNAASQKQQHCPSSRKLASTTDEAEMRTERPCLQSSVSAIELIDISISPPSSVSNMPVPGLSPAAVSEAEALGRGDVDVFDVPKAFFKDQVRPREGGVSPKQESQGHLSISSCNALASRPSSKEPELVVLSDSEEEMETGPAAVCSLSPSPPSPYPSQHGHSYTQIKTLPKVKHVENSQESCNSNTQSSPVPDLDQPGLCSAGLDPSPMDCSPEVSWLIPATPDPHSRSTSSSSTQTYSSMRRSQLFPKNSSSSLSSSQSASPSRSLSLKNRPHTSVSPLRLRASEHITRADGGSVDSSSHSPVCTVTPSPHFRVRPSSVARSQPLPLQQGDSIQGTPLHKHCPAYSSTPLNMDLPQPPALAVASPLLSDHDRETSTRRGSTLSQSPEKRALGTLHLSLSDNPVSQPSSLHRCPSSLPGDSVSSSHTRCSSQSDYHEGSKAAEVTGEKPEGSEEGERVSEVEEKGTDTERLNDSAMSVKEDTEKADISECSFQQSFMAMDDPPMVFDDSWGLNAGADGDDVPSVRFSLRLEDSGGASPLQRNAGGGEMMEFSTPTTTRSPRPRSQSPTHAGPSFTPSPPTHISPTTTKVNASLLDSKIWDSWEEGEEEQALTLSQRVNPASPFKTPVTSRSRKRPSLVPITPMPSYSDMDTPDLKNKLNRFGVRPLPKRQMVLKLKEIHQYTHQIAGSESEDEAPSKSLPTTTTTTSSAALSTRPGSCAKAVTFKQPSHDVNHHSEEDAEPLSASQGSNASSTAASEDSERSNPELCLSSDGDSDSDVTASQASSRHEDRLQAVRSFILSDPALYSQILQYQPLVLSHLQARLKAAGIRLAAAKLLDYLDSQCITFTTAKPSRSAPTRRRARGQGARGAARGGARGRKRGAATAVA